MSGKALIAKLRQMAKDNESEYSYSDLLKLREQGNKEFIDTLATEADESALNWIIGRSGIMPIHKDCTVENYVVTTEGQNNARNFANYYIDSFSENKGECFVFSGTTGTGKNHLSAAICNNLMRKGYTCLIITVSELMTKSRKCYGDKPEFSEDDFIKNMVAFDLLIIDEIGLQKNTDHEKIILNQIIDRRLGHLKPIGILTNLDKTGSEKLLGSRIMSRLRSNNGQWIIFNWSDYR